MKEEKVDETGRGRIYGLEAGKTYKIDSSDNTLNEIGWNDTYTIPIDYQEKQKKEEKELQKKKDVYRSGGHINPELGRASFTVLIDEKGNLSVPSFIRSALGIFGRRTNVQCVIQLQKVKNKYLIK